MERKKSLTWYVIINHFEDFSSKFHNTFGSNLFPSSSRFFTGSSCRLINTMRSPHLVAGNLSPESSFNFFDRRILLVVPVPYVNFNV
ncbi:MAG: hypothetical protein ACYDCP_10290 [Thermoplasmataceae archaeon]